MPQPPFDLVFLSGMDGTGELFKPLLSQMGPGWNAHIVTYPPDRKLGYAELVRHIESQIPTNTPIVLIAESFAGPLALMHAAQHPSDVRGIVLSASFICAPAPTSVLTVARWLLRYAPYSPFMIRFLLLGWKAPSSFMQVILDGIKRVDREVLIFRLEQTFQTDCSPLFDGMTKPLLYLQAERDLLVRPKSLRRILLLKPDTVVRTLPTPHMLLQAAPQEAWRFIEAFLQTLR